MSLSIPRAISFVTPQSFRLGPVLVLTATAIFLRAQRAGYGILHVHIPSLVSWQTIMSSFTSYQSVPDASDLSHSFLGQAIYSLGQLHIPETTLYPYLAFRPLLNPHRLGRITLTLRGVSWLCFRTLALRFSIERHLPAAPFILSSQFHPLF